MEKPIVFGLGEYKGKFAGIHLQNVSIDNECSTAEAMNENGEVEQVDAYGAKSTIQGDGNVEASPAEEVLQLGATITVNGLDYLITKVGEKRTVNGHATKSFTGVAPLVTSGGQVTSGGEVGGGQS